jgi:hypothetical protein
VYRVLVGNLREKNRLEYPGVDGMIIIRCIVTKWNMGLWTGFSCHQDRDRWRTLVFA